MLCRSYTKSDKRTGLRVCKILDGKPSKNLPKVLVTEPQGHDDLLDYLSVYQTQDHFKGVHYHPEGALCWYSCNRYGEPTGKVVFARRVPYKDLIWSYARKKEFRMKGLIKKDWKLKELISREPRYEDYITTKPRLYQSGDRKKGKKQNG